MTEYQKESLRIYMNYHVSELKNLHPETVKRWCEGQELYEKQLNQCGHNVAITGRLKGGPNE